MLAESLAFRFSLSRRPQRQNGILVAATSVVPLGDCKQVINAASKTESWATIGHANTAGIIDRDYYTSTPIESNIIRLDFHEIESYLCHPFVFSEIVSRAGICTSGDPTPEQVLDIIAGLFRPSLMQVTTTRTLNRISRSYAPGLPRAELRKIRSQEMAAQAIQFAIENEREKGIFTVEHGLELFAQEYEKATRALEQRNIDNILQLAPAKEILDPLCRRFEFKDKHSLATALVRHIRPDELPLLAGLRKAVVSVLRGQTVGTPASP